MYLVKPILFMNFLSKLSVRLKSTFSENTTWLRRHFVVELFFFLILENN